MWQEEKESERINDTFLDQEIKYKKSIKEVFDLNKIMGD